MDARRVEELLGLPPGETLMSLVRLAYELDEAHPGGALAELFLYMDWLELEEGASWSAMGTPRNVRAFAETGGDGNHFGFLMDDPELNTDDRPIVRVEPKSDDDTEIIAPDLAAFLGLLSISHGEAMSRRMNDDDWFSVREDWIDDPVRLQVMRSLSLRLIALPDVERPDSPSAVARCVPDQVFEIDFGGEPIPVEVEVSEEGRRRQAGMLCFDAYRAGRIQDAEFLASVGQDDPRFGARARWVLAHCAWTLGAKRRARALARALAEAWIDPAPPVAPSMHPRTSIPRDELVALLELVTRGPGYEELMARVHATPDDLEPDGEFL